jgi:ABC-type multidrug transport system ATPase subunit
MRSGPAATAIAPVQFAGAGAKDHTRYVIRLASFRLDAVESGRPALGIVTPRPAAAAALAGLLSGRIAPSHGQLLVLGQDLTRLSGRLAVRPRIGVASRANRTWPAITIRGLVVRAARRSGQRRSDRGLLVAAILDRLGLTPWAEVQLRAAPDLIARRARLAAACVHQPELLVIDGLFDQLSPADRVALARTVTEFKRDTAVVVIGRDADTMLLCCDQVVSEADGIVLGQYPLPPASVHKIAKIPPFDHAR